MAVVVGEADHVSIQASWTRRDLLAALGLVLTTGLTATVSEVIFADYGSRSTSSRIDLEAKIERFFWHFDNQEYAKALAMGLTITESYRAGDPAQYCRWLNNIACVSVWDGQFERAHDFLSRACGASVEPSAWWLPIVTSNLAYVRYHLGWRTYDLIHHVEQAVLDLQSTQVPRQAGPWLQLWSRMSPTGVAAPNTLVPPFAVLTRLYSREGRYREAFESGEKDIEIQGEAAQGMRIILGLIARPAYRERAAFEYVEEVDQIYSPSSSSAHMMALRDVIIADLKGTAPTDEYSFSGQVGSIKSVYYSWTTFADLKYLLAASNSRHLRNEFGRRVLESYEESEHSGLESVQRIRRLLGA
ncbi:hypothetical protein [Streptomyces sp. NPDC006335]|uniref:hypothetical protein n=1 Tax=Streptomyces sp. NPDC006335 TaxID=3156895 RepID=UPI0033AB6DF6